MIFIDKLLLPITVLMLIKWMDKERDLKKNDLVYIWSYYFLVCLVYFQCIL